MPTELPIIKINGAEFYTMFVAYLEDEGYTVLPREAQRWYEDRCTGGPFKGLSPDIQKRFWDTLNRQVFDDVTDLRYAAQQFRRWGHREITLDDIDNLFRRYTSARRRRLHGFMCSCFQAFWTMKEDLAALNSEEE